MEQAYLNAKQPDLAINAYLESGKINEAIRVAKKYRPDLADQICQQMGQGDVSQMSTE